MQGKVNKLLCFPTQATNKKEQGYPSSLASPQDTLRRTPSQMHNKKEITNKLPQKCSTNEEMRQVILQSLIVLR